MPMAILAALATLAAALPVRAQGPDTALSITPRFPSVEVREDERNELQEARFNSGLGLKLSNDFLQVAVDYRVQSRLLDGADNATLSQQLAASLHSATLNEMLGLDADVRARSTIKANGDSYLYSITPGFSKSLPELGRLSVRYEYLLDKAGARALEKEKLGYRMGLEGSAQNGRLTWLGKYRSTDVYHGVEQLQSTALFEFESGYQLAPELKLGVSGLSRDETRFRGGLESNIYRSIRYGAGLSWSPSPEYSLAFQVNKLEDSREQGDELFGSGTVSWFPRQDMEFTFSYGDHLVDGARGVMFSTKIDLNES